ncbi:cyclin-dependent kinase inhibitor 1Bb [Callorhinchus milii]|uniref:Cyclin-dependent kinase inhibitor 1B n=2 Tax=Callorhinchus milii TaxID=7868 RepID=V9KVY0_CALMI|nr:cyclin-dependent kinase inhibitor 1Bb [Callorhinchus milii]|eukprot:gi/632954024/ref/XP_007892745.1/ PREDICTED: cyclin-dependent kinase inhibitor 1B [Callorhinchus milii]
MSNVRISNGSPTLERMAAQQPGHPKPSACRSLFGPVDHDELSRDLQKKRNESHEQDRLRWNFDFERDKPLDGNYKWEAVDFKDVPDFYWRQTRERVSPADCGVDVNGNRAIVYIGTTVAQGNAAGDTYFANSERSDAVKETAERCTDSKEQCSAPRKRTASVDCSPEAKRVTTKAESEWSANSPSLSAFEQTPKKSIPSGHHT